MSRNQTILNSLESYLAAFAVDAEVRRHIYELVRTCMENEAVVWVNAQRINGRFHFALNTTEPETRPSTPALSWRFGPDTE